jgi:hypothetical protein
VIVPGRGAQSFKPICYTIELKGAVRGVAPGVLNLGGHPQGDKPGFGRERHADIDEAAIRVGYGRWLDCAREFSSKLRAVGTLTSEELTL